MEFIGIQYENGPKGHIKERFENRGIAPCHGGHNELRERAYREGQVVRTD